MKKLIEKLKALRIYAVMRSAYRKLYWWNVKITCKHQLTTEVYRCYQDRYVKEQCNVCNKELYFDL
jgi:ribonuclease I